LIQKEEIAMDGAKLKYAKFAFGSTDQYQTNRDLSLASKLITQPPTYQNRK